MDIAITQRNDKNRHGDRYDNLENNYVKYLEGFGIRLMIIPNITKNLETYTKVKGIIISGGNDINPQSYGGNKTDSVYLSAERDSTEENLLRIAIEKKIPVLGICRGYQFINVFFGGKLIGGINEKEKRHVGITHRVDVIDEKCMELLGDGFEVNSYHNFGVDESVKSKDLEVFAQANDGIIEGMFHPKLPIAGIQWHPERKSPDMASNEKIIKAFLNKKLFWK